MQQSSRCSGVAIIGDASTSATSIGSRKRASGCARRWPGTAPRSARAARASCRTRACGASRPARRSTPSTGRRDLELAGPGVVGAVVGERDLGDAGVARGGVRDDHDVGHAGRDRERRVAGVRDERGAADVGRVEPARVDAQVLGDLRDRHLQAALGRERRRGREPVDVAELQTGVGERAEDALRLDRERVHAGAFRRGDSYTPTIATSPLGNAMHSSGSGSGGSMRAARTPGYSVSGSALRAPARRDARRLVRHLGVDRRPRRVHHPARQVVRGAREQRREVVRAWSPIARPRIAMRGDTRRHRGDRELVRVDRRELVPARTASTPGRRPGPARPRPPNTVLCGAFWLKSTNTRAPRSSFHHAAGEQVGPAALQLAGSATAAGAHVVGVPARLERARRCGCRGGRWSSAKPVMPSSASSARASRGRLAHHLERRRPGDGSRSIRSSSACSGSSAGVGHAWKPRQPRFTAHRTWARSAATSASDSVPFGGRDRRGLRAIGRASSGTRFWKNDLPQAPSG